MRRALLLALLLLAARPALADGEAQGLVDRSTLSLQEVLGEGDQAARDDAQGFLRRARAVVVCPQVFRAGFILGGQGGGCVMVARDAAGSWSSPAFYGLASGSVGLQIGVQDMQILMLVMSDRGLTALMDSQFKLGADVSVAVATVGAGLAGATTAAAGADIIAFARTRGLFAGVALEGSLLTACSALNRAYYGQDISARQIVVAMQVHNPGADPLRAALMRFGSAPTPTASAAVAPHAAPPGRVEATSLAPIAGVRR
jgi:SH3 domain-containing YSC84-like protein 1